MNYLIDLFNPDFSHAIIVTLLHSLWQSLLLAGVLYSMLFYVKKPNFRYVLSYSTLLLFFVVNVITFNLVNSQAEVNNLKNQEAIQHEVLVVGHSTLNADLNGLIGIPAHYLDYVFILWIIGLVFISLKMMGGLWYLIRLRALALPIDNSMVSDKLQELLSRTGMRIQIGLRMTAQIGSPVVTGIIKPLILFPIGSINALNLEETEAIIAHELAHIRRHDYLMNIIQVFIETLYYFNPLLWWISRIIREERENACDDMACDIIHNKFQYVNALVRMKEIEMQNGKMILSFSGNKNQLFNRINRILGNPVQKSFIMEKITVLLVSMILIFFFSSAKMTHDYTVEENLCDEEGIFTELLEMKPPQDSIPAKKKVKKTIIKEEGGKTVEMTVENGKVKNLKIDDKKVPDTEFDAHKDLIKELEKELDGNSQERNLWTKDKGNRVIFENADGEDTEVEVFSDLLKYKSKHKTKSPFYRYHADKIVVESETDENGNTILKIESKDDEDPIIIQVPDDGGSVIIEGEEMLDGQRAIIIDEDYSVVSPRIAERIRVHPKFKGFQFRFDEDASKAYFKSLEEFNKDKMVWADDANVFFYDQKKMKDHKFDEQDFIYQYEIAKDNHAKAKARIKGMKDRRASVFTFPDNEVKFKYREFEPFFLNSSSIGSNQIEKKLMKDGLISDTENYEFKMTDKKLKINGKKQSRDVFESYKSFIEERMGKEVKGDFNMHIKKNNT